MPNDISLYHRSSSREGGDNHIISQATSDSSLLDKHRARDNRYQMALAYSHEPHHSSLSPADYRQEPQYPQTKEMNRRVDEYIRSNSGWTTGTSRKHIFQTEFTPTEQTLYSQEQDQARRAAQASAGPSISRSQTTRPPSHLPTGHYPTLLAGDISRPSLQSPQRPSSAWDQGPAHYKPKPDEIYKSYSLEGALDYYPRDKGKGRASNAEQTQWQIEDDAALAHQLQYQEDASHQPSDSQSNHEQTVPSRSNRSDEMLQIIANAYISAGNQKNLSDEHRKAITQRPFTQHDLAQLRSAFQTAENAGRINKDQRIGLYKTVQRQSERGKETNAKYKQSGREKGVRTKYEQSDRGKVARTKYKQSDRGKEANAKYEQSERRKVARTKYEQ